MDEFLKPPPGWRYEAYPWFAMDEVPELPKLLRVGHVLLPEFFHLAIGTEDAWYRDRSGAETPQGGDTLLFLNFQIYEDQIEMTEARTAFADLPVVFERVRKIVKPDKWKRLGIHYMTQYLVRFMEEEGRPETDRMKQGYDWPSVKDPSPYGHKPKVALEWLDQLQAHASEAYAAAREQPSPRRKRNRITDEFLQEVAKVYNAADTMGLPPTREVANHYKAPHSTAAKWVATARRKKFLPPVEGGAAGQKPLATYGDTAKRASKRSALEKEVRRLQLEQLAQAGKRSPDLGAEEDMQEAIDDLRRQIRELEG
ncbi:hypothetical protein [Streptomyces asiaticus]|uniref:hypothetical protein n=1 Tax=Streptomyces asiaticus TaxID=114695 RepID=UPI003F67C2AC